ncbi:thioredoxin-disulfide reductase [Actinomyces sp.]|uniref:thioredoxin-disulfide reductase n=1 Tax=Actinomyces sp. TaxID=29317 RepID=UPI002912BCDB|nr:thioredoxin-disulfide reductase [Actinomyces sp.]MDU5231221.1 thioredoxin-disulfide reductase [Actinomyces sp.]MDU6756722.1 thioredoxin-disulfide reductase [Actinomyces sp.]
MVHDLIIVGSGPAGYTAAIYASRAGLKPIVFAGSFTAGGALMNTTEVENFPGFPEGVMGPELMVKMQEQAEKFGADVRMEDVERLDLASDVKVVVSDGEEFQARAVIVATGAAYRTLGLEGEQTYAGRGVSYCATCDGFFFRDKQIAVVGGGDSAMEEALFLSRFGKVTVIHRRDELRASKILQERALADPNISFAWNSVVVDMKGETSLQSLILEDTVTGERRELDTDGLFIAIGHDPRTELVKDQLELEGAYIKVADPTTNTSVPGVFACGDVADPRYRQAITAAGTGAKAALDVQHYLENL